jgi:hypothetical protein
MEQADEGASLAQTQHYVASDAAYARSALRHLFGRSMRRTFAGYVDGCFAFQSCARTVRYSKLSYYSGAPGFAGNRRVFAKYIPVTDDVSAVHIKQEIAID